MSKRPSDMPDDSSGSCQQEKKPKTTPLVSDEDEEPAICPVCCSEFDHELHQAFTNPCSHTVCEPCLRRLCRDGFECVVCRRPIQGFDQAVRCRSLEDHNEALKPQQQSWSKFAVGATVFIVGINGRPQLNGQKGLIVQFVPERDRFRVQLQDMEVVALKKINLKPDCDQQIKPGAELKQMARERGNNFFRAKQFESAIREFSVALLHDSGDHQIYSNRSAAHAALHNYVAALQDGQQAVTICPQFSKGWSRVGAANHGLGNMPGAIRAYKLGLKLDPSSETMRKALVDAEKRRVRQQDQSAQRARKSAPSRRQQAAPGNQSSSEPSPPQQAADFMSQSFSDLMIAVEKAFEGDNDGAQASNGRSQSDCSIC